MTDTPPEIARMVREKIMALSGEMRFIMGAQMFESAREMVEASTAPGLVEDGTAPATVQTHLRERT